MPMSRPTRTTALCFFLAVPALLAGAQEVIPHRQDRLPNRPYSPR